jgi:hypothetical protein
MKEECIHDFSIYGMYGFQFATSEIDSFCKIDLMIKRIEKRGLEGLLVKIISGKIERFERFHHRVSDKNRQYTG